MQCVRSNDENPEKARERALQDPEVQEILRDPSMFVFYLFYANKNLGEFCWSR